MEKPVLGLHLPCLAQYGWYRPCFRHVEGFPSLSTCMEAPLKVFHFTSVSWVVLCCGKTGFGPTFAMFGPIQLSSTMLLPCGRLPLPFYMYGRLFQGISLHVSVMGGAGLWKIRFWAYTCRVWQASDMLLLCIAKVTHGFCGVDVLLWPYFCYVLT